MQVGILPAAPLPGGVKVARRPVKPLVLVRVQVWQPFSGCNVSSRRPCSERGGRRCNSCHPDHFWKAGRYKLAAPVLKTGSASPRSEHYRRLPPSSRSSKAEHPADNRKTQERYLPGRPGNFRLPISNLRLNAANPDFWCDQLAIVNRQSSRVAEAD